MKISNKVYLIGAFIIIGLMIFLFSRKNKDQVVLKKAVIEIGNIRNEISTTGTINPISTVAVGTQVSGIVSKIFVKHNDIVKKGQVIAEIDRTTLLATLKDVESNQYKSKVQLEQAQKEHERNKVLLEQEAITQVEYENAYYAFLTAKADYNSALSQVDKAKTNLGYATIVAPINGVILSKDIDVGQTVAASFNTPTLFTIAEDLSKMEIQASVDEADIGLVKVGQKVNFTVDAFPEDSFEGAVKEIRLQSVVTSNVVTYTVIIDVNNDKLLLMPGMTANISIIIEESKNTMLAPVASVKFLPPPGLLNRKKANPDSNKISRPSKGIRKDRSEFAKELQNDPLKSGMERTVWIVRNDSIYPQKVILGISDGSQIELKGNSIQPGDSLAIGYVESSSKPAGAQKNPFTPQRPKRQ